ncbi:hypothetical protein, partial [Salmonella enterica]|uniref:hypothetical protein n=1 Tax=Salmonella enterica TaxID=28901 RepID=UPI003CF486BA
LKFNVIHATDKGKITNPLCNGDNPNCSWRYTGMYKLNPIKQIAVKRSVINTKVIDRLNSITGKNGEDTLFSTLNNRITTITART